MHRSTWTLSLRRAPAALLMAALALLAPMAARAADVNYTLQPLAQIGGMAGDVPIPKGLIWVLGPLNDNGQLLVDAGTPDNTQPEILLQYAAGKFTPLVAAGMDGPLGPWPNDVVNNAFSMNQSGNSVFQVIHADGGRVGTFYRNAQSGKMTAVALKGMSATGNWTFTDGGAVGPQINDRDEIALAEIVTGPGSPGWFGLFFRTPDAALQPIFLPGQALPDGTQASYGPEYPSITDAGVVAFLAQRSGDDQYSAYQWEKGNASPLVTVGMEAPGGGKIAGVSIVLLNNQNPSALIGAHVAGTSGSVLYRLANGTLTAAVVPGQEMPGGGKFKSIADVSPGGPDVTFAISNATEAGQHAFIATLDDNSTGVYRLGADGTLALVAKSGTTTPLGKITRFGPSSPPALNSKGQVVVSISFDNGPDTLVLLTPVTP